MALRRHPIEYRLRWPDLDMFDLSSGDVVFDVGANVGDFVECVLAYQPRVIVHAFEPVSEAFEVLARRFGSYPGIYCLESALGAEQCERRIYISKYIQASSFLENGRRLNDKVYGIDFATKRSAIVPVETVTKYLRDHGIGRVKLLKLDVQGYEIEVLKGAREAFELIDFIYAEAQFQELYKGGPLFNDLFDFLSERYELLRMTSFRTDNDGKLMECDMIFKSRGVRASG
jgi:FkbM family methyltransferase